MLQVSTELSKQIHLVFEHALSRGQEGFHEWPVIKEKRVYNTEDFCFIVFNALHVPEWANRNSYKLQLVVSHLMQLLGQGQFDCPLITDSWIF